MIAMVARTGAGEPAFGRPLTGEALDAVHTEVRKRDMLKAARDIRDLRSPPGNRLEALKGELSGLHSIRINDQWRLVFHWQGYDAEDVRILDDHRG